MWGSYNGTAAQRCKHGGVNYHLSLQMVDPNNEMTANHVKTMWQQAKEKFALVFRPTNRDLMVVYQNFKKL